MNCPTVALIDGKFRSDLEETGMGFAREVDVLGQASRMGLFTKAFCTTADEALAMAEAGVDNIIVHFGNSSGGTSARRPCWRRRGARARGRDPGCAGGRVHRPHRHLPRRRDRDPGATSSASCRPSRASTAMSAALGGALPDRDVGGRGHAGVPRIRLPKGR